MPGDAVLDGVARGEEEHAHVRAYCVRSVAQHGEAVGVRQHDVEDDRVGQQGACLGDGGGAVAGGAYLPALVAQDAGEDLGEVGVVVDDEDPDRGAVGPGQGEGGRSARWRGGVHRRRTRMRSRRVPGSAPPTSEFARESAAPPRLL